MIRSDYDPTIESVGLDAVENSDIGSIMDIFVLVHEEDDWAFVCNKVTGRVVMQIYDQETGLMSEWREAPNMPVRMPRPIQ